MGIDATIYYGPAIVVNTYYLDPEWKFFLDAYFEDRDYDDNLISIDGYSKVSEQLITFWAREPQTLFPQNYDRRPLVINDNKQLKLMKPTANGIDLDNEELWNSSYEGFHINILPYGNDAIRNTIKVVKEKLIAADMSELIPLIEIKDITLIGEWLVYLLH